MKAPHDLTRWAQKHDYGRSNTSAEQRTRWVLWITVATMIIEIIAGGLTRSMAVLADGWHMSSHALAIGLSVLAYAAARRFAHDPRFSFGVWKIEVLAGYTSAILLLGVAATMLFSAAERLLYPEAIRYGEAMMVAIGGLIINLLCALILGNDHSHQAQAHHAEHDHQHVHSHASTHDLNLKAAYLHVLADALTSVLAIVALAGGWRYGWHWLDPAMGLVGAVLVGIWARKLLFETGQILLDRAMDRPVVDEIRAVVAELASGDCEITDLHIWRVGGKHYACVLSLLTHDASLRPLAVREALSSHEALVHITVEIHHCDQCSSA